MLAQVQFWFKVKFYPGFLSREGCFSISAEAVSMCAGANESQELFDPAVRAAQVRGKLIARRAPAFDLCNRLRIFAIEARLGTVPEEACLVFKLNSRSFTTACVRPDKDGVCRWGTPPELTAPLAGR